MSKRETSVKKQRSKSDQPSHEHIAIRAYEIYISRGAEHGRDLDDWLRAERELTSKNNNSAQRHSLAI